MSERPEPTAQNRSAPIVLHAFGLYISNAPIVLQDFGLPVGTMSSCRLPVLPESLQSPVASTAPRIFILGYRLVIVLGHVFRAGRSGVVGSSSSWSSAASKASR